jgi:Cd2+/Zn2+-exporting ATPase
MRQMSSKVDVEAEAFEEGINRKVWVLLAALLGSTILVCELLDFLVRGVPLGFAVPILNRTATLSMVVYLSSVIAAAVYVGFIGLRELIVERRFSVEFLMAVAGVGAVSLGLLFEAASVLFLYSVAEYFEGFIEERARGTVEKLSRFMPDNVRVMADGTERIVSVKEAVPGMVLLVKPGERIPLDGTVVEGFSQVDQSLVTGESLPVLRRTGDRVFAGTLSTTGVLRVSVTGKAEDTLVSRIAKLVVQSRRRKASIEKLVDRFAKIYVPIVIALAAFTATFMPLIFRGGIQTWLYRALIVLVVSCPSAFIVSVPAAIFAAITAAAKRGVIVKGGVFVEKLARVKTVVFDKTGTLTLGVPSVHEVRSVEGSDNCALLYAAGLDQFSNHPVAQAIVRRAAESGLDVSGLKVTDVTEIPGKGIVGYVNGTHVAVGNAELMKDYACDCERVGQLLENDKHTSVCVSVSKSGAASVCVMDDVRKDAVDAINALKKAGISTAMLTGDKAEIADEVAGMLKVDEVHAELLPEDKLKVINEMKTRKGLVAMVGDGVNDAPALAASDVGIAMGGSHVDIALDSADVVLVKDELAQIPYLIGLSGKTMEVARQNIAASLVVKMLLGGLGLMGLIPLWFTVASGDDGVTLLLLLNTLRLTHLGP